MRKEKMGEEKAVGRTTVAKLLLPRRMKLPRQSVVAY